MKILEGYKTYLGLLLIISTVILNATGLITESTTNQLLIIFGAFSGIFIRHAIKKVENKK